MLPTFEVLFGIPYHHRLVFIRSRSRGGPMRGIYWTHEEVDQSGTVIARYESYEQVDRSGRVRRGWRKYDASGCLIGQQIIPESGSVQTKRQAPFAA